MAKKKLEEKLLEAVDDSELTEKQKLFCVYFVSCHNATQAYLKAYGGKRTTAEVEGWKLLRNPKIGEEIANLKAIMRSEYRVDIHDYINYLLKVVGADIGDYIKFGRKTITAKGTTKEVNSVKLTDSENIDTSIITEVKEGRDGVTFKLEDKKWAWEQLAKYLGFEGKAEESEATIIELPAKE